MDYQCSDEIGSGLTTPITTEEIVRVVNALPNNKAPGPDGFPKEFYVAAWPIIGVDVIISVQSFFLYGFLPRSVNATALSLIPKKRVGENIKDYHPIACFNFIYMIISKILANRLKSTHTDSIEQNQCAFV